LKSIQKPYKISKGILFLWGGFFILFPFYIFGSGMPQPADWIMVILFAYFFFTEKVFPFKDQVELIRKHRNFVIYVAVLNTIWYFFIDQSKEYRFPTFVHSLFYIYNFFALMAAIRIYNKIKDRFFVITAYSVGLSILLQVALSFSGVYAGGRDELFFNNPNQLGYYALLSGSLFIYLSKYVKLNPIFQISVLLAFVYITLISASKAAFAGAIILTVLATINQGLLNIKQFLVIIIATGLAFYIFTKSDRVQSVFEYTVNRFSNIGNEGDDSYEGRGYDRILNDPEYMIIGAGEGGYYRFDTLLGAGEIHSTFGTLVFSYGIPGTILFMMFIFHVFRSSSVMELMYIVPVAAYSVTHQGFRNTLFWVFLACIYIINFEKRKAKAELKYKKYMWMKQMRNKNEVQQKLNT
jgi:hypothetical protein